MWNIAGEESSLISCRYSYKIKNKICERTQCIDKLCALFYV
ncbi:hypothetical protein HMPREF1584_00367 [Gardnerella vaginalis JCP8481A]|uniref:Uncharacterized protein n=1 Tax=Gardnerella vaginalis TaxID=2702 RepID=A0A133NSF4_GARVA|nr:hypothetical protein HMPREF1585_00866 [Gardnerella vaginalis JCP8481B]EPI44024.1 hypothetical protein HMPREF1584_00367 [Gardnerella vaginalis JCP8481A]KXA19213.1 hypothetical protein HMPREF3208_01199 [Gardnerella vaginalis]